MEPVISEQLSVTSNDGQPANPTHGTPHEQARSGPTIAWPGLIVSASLLSGLAGQHTTLLNTRPAPTTGGPGKFPDIIMGIDGAIVLCPWCSGSDASKDGDFFICRACGSVWRQR